MGTGDWGLGTGDCTSAPLSDQGLGTGDWGMRGFILQQFSGK
ncbi:MAG: hypothetical protein HEQ35_31360 [Gloeotrichia echinulata IR180]